MVDVYLVDHKGAMSAKMAPGRGSFCAAFAALLALRVAAGHDCVHDEVLHEHIKEYWHTDNVAYKNASQPDAPARVMTRRQLHDILASESKDGTVPEAGAARRRLETKAQYLARTWGPVRINVEFVDIRSDPDMTTAKADYLEYTVLPAAVARLAAALEVCGAVRGARSFQWTPAHPHGPFVHHRCDESLGRFMRSASAAPRGPTATVTPCQTAT